MTLRTWVLATALFLGACSSGSDVLSPALTTIVAPVQGETETADSSGAIDDSQDEDSTAEAEPAPVPLSGSLTATVVNTYPHDSNAFTQGLEIFDGRFIESTGLYGESDRRIVDIESGEILEIFEIDTALFGEGITIVGDELIQLTWRSRFYLRADLQTLAETERGIHEGEGWGLCFDGQQLVMSNGSSTLTFRDPETFDATRTVEVTLDGEPVELLNELECVNGQVLANVWLSDLIVVIDPADGTIVATLDGSVLRPPDLPVEQSRFALNGIAHDPDTGHFYLTGKWWPVVYEVELS